MPERSVVISSWRIIVNIMKKPILFLSVLVNVLLLAYFLVFSGLRLPEKEANADLAHTPTFDASLVQDGDDVSVLYSLQSKYLPKMTAPAAHYWKPSADIMVKISEDKVRTDELIRDELLQIYGDSAKTITALEQYFYPLGPGFEFLNSDVQIEVAGIRDAHRKSMMGLAGRGIESLGTARSREAVYWDQLKQILSPDELLEFELRESGVAQQMRNINFDWNESEFREVYKVRRKQSNSSLLMGMMSGTSAYNEEIKAHLGEDRYKEYILAADPSLIRFKEQAVKAGLNNTEIDSAVDIYIDYGDRISLAMNSSNRRKAAQLSAERDSEISGLTGIKTGTRPKMPFEVPQSNGLRSN